MQVRETANGGRKKDANALKKIFTNIGEQANEAVRTAKAAQPAARTESRPQWSPGDVFFNKGDPAEIAPRAQDPEEVRRAIENGETVRPASWSANEDGMEAWGRELERFVAQAEADSTARNGVWQDTSAFEDYRQKQTASMVRFRQQADRYRDFFDSHRDIYGDREVDSILERLDRGTAALTGLGGYLREEGTFRGQFADQDEFDTYQRLQNASVDELKLWNEELDEEIGGLKRQLRERTRHGLVNNPEVTRAYYERLQTSIDRKQQTRNRVLRRYYELENQGKLAELEQDPEATVLYRTADQDTTGTEEMVRRMLDRLDRGGRPEEDPAALEVIRRELGISPEQSGSTARYMNDLMTASMEYITGTDDARSKAIRSLEDMGYNYERLAEYRQTQEDAARYVKEQERIRQTARDHPWLTSSATILGAPGQAVEALDMAIRGIGHSDADDIENYVPLNVYDMPVTNYISGTRGAVAEMIAENTEGLELLGVNVPSFLYQTTMSMGDSVLHASLLGPAGLAFMGGEAAANQMQDIIARGGNNTQVLLGGLAAGVAEAAFEKFSFDYFLKPKTISGWKDVVKNIAVQSGIEASEEVFTEIANILSDTAIMGRDSSAELAVRAYMMQGMSEEEARKQLFYDQIGQVAQAGVGGLLAGMGMGGISSTANYALGGGQVNSVESTQYQNRAEQAGPLARAAREMHMGESQEAAQGPTPQVVQNTTPAAQTAQEAAQSAAQGIQRTGADTSARPRMQSAMENANALVKASEVFGENGRKAFAAAWDGQTDSAQYYAGFSTWYQAGLDGKSQSQVRGPYAGSISEAQRVAAYDSGQRDAAASLAKEKAAAPYARTAGTEAEFVHGDYVTGLVERGELDAKTVDRMDTVAKDLGVRVRFVDSVAEGRANGQYSDGEILIAKDAVDPVAQVLGHEITHRVQELAPEQYRIFRQAALENMADSAVRAKIDNYRAQGETIQYEAAMDDAAADYAGQLLEDGKLLDEFIDRHRTDRSLLQKLRDAFRALWQKLTGVERQKAQTAEGKLAAALDAAAEQAKALTEGAEGQGADGNVRYSLKAFDDGKRFVDVETDQAQFDGLSEREMRDKAEEVIKARFVGKVVGIDNRVFVNNYTAREYGYSARKISPSVREAKFRASTELDNLLDAGSNFRTAPDGRDGHVHPNSTGDFQYFDTIFKVGGEYYQGTINIQQVAKGLLLKDITKIKNITQDIGSSYGESPQSTFLRDVSMDSVPQSGGEVKPRYSLKAFDDGKRFVDVETDQAQFDGLSEREQGRLATQIIKERFAGRVIGLDNRVFVNGRSASEYGFPAKHLSADEHDAKMRASTELDNLVDAGTNFRTAPDGRDGHTHPNAKGGFQYFDTIFKVGGQYYRGVINIMQTGHGLLLKDVTQIENVTQAISSSYGQSPKSTILRDVSMDSVPQSGGEVKPRYSLKEYDEHQRENWANSKRIVVYESQEQLQRFVQDALAKKNLEKKLYFGAISPELAARILKDTGVEVEGYNCTISAYEIQKILKNSHGDQQAEAARGQRPITAQDIELIPTIITSPDSITLGDRLYNGRPVILFSKTINGRTTVVSYVSQKHMDLTVQTMYAGKNKKSLATPPGEVSPVPHTSETLSGIALENNIPQSGGENNPQYSLKGATITKTYNQLLRENDALRERLTYWRGQTRTTENVTTDRKAVADAAKALIKDYGVQMDARDLTGRLQTLYDALASGKTGGGEIGPTYAWEQAEQIARDIAGSAVSEWSLSDEFPGLKEKLRTTRLSISHEYDNDIRNENFRREYRGKLNLTSKEGTNVDAVYAELAEAYPGLFPEDITHPAEQLEQIMDVTDSLYTVDAQSRFSGQMEEAVTGITGEIVEGFFDLPQTRATMADRYEAKLDKAKAHGKQRVAETREQYQARMDKLRQENRQAVRNAIDRERATRQRQLQALKDRHAQSRENARGRRADSKARDRLLHIVRRLQNAKLPEVNRTLLNEYIGDLDTAAKSMTGQTLAKLENLRDWYSEQKASNPDFIADPHIEDALKRLSKRQIGDLSAQEVADLTQVLLNIENEIRTQRKLIDSQERRDVYAAGEAAIRDIEASAGSRPTGLFAFLDKNIVTETLSPLRQVRRITGYAPDSPLTRVTQELADGQRTMKAYEMRANAQFAGYTGDKGFTRSFAGPKAKGIQIQGLGRDGPVTVTITPAMRASLYLHSLNDQNLRHIRDGGIKVPNWKLYQKGKIAEAYDRGTIIKLTPSQVRSITAGMTRKERAFAMAAHHYFNVTSKEAVNAVSEKLKGYSIAQVEDYFPIRTDSSFTRADFESVKFDGTIEGMGFLKERVNAGNPILLRDMSAELDQSIQLHGKYVGLAIPVRNFNKLWNVTTGQWVDGDAAMDYNGDEGGGTDGLEETAGYNRRGETGEGLYTDAGGAGENGEGPGGIPAWAEGAQVQDPGEPAKQAVKTVRGYGVRAMVVQDAAIKARNPNAMALTEGGVVYLSDALTEEDASVGHHEAVHAVKQRGSAAYEALLEQEADRVDFHGGNTVLALLLNSRLPGKDITSLNQADMRTLFDELNALVWGYHMDDQANAKEKFSRVFHDYDGLIGEMSRIMEQARQEGESRYGGERPAGNQSISGKTVREKAGNAYAGAGGTVGTETAGTGAGAENTRVAHRHFQYEDSVKNAVKNKWGEAGYGYIEKMMSDLQNGHKPTKTWSKAMNRLRSNYAGAVLTLNASVAMKQAASYPTAAAVLGWGPLAKAMKNFGRVDLDLIAKYTPLQWYRSKGFSTQELGDMASRNKQLPKVLNWVQGVDLITTRKLWKASEYYVRAHNKALNPGTDAYYRAVADIYNQVIEETQPNYTTMQRPQLLRSDDNFLANLQMFKTQPFQNFNIVYDAAGEFTAAMRRGDKAQIKTARAKLGRSVTSQLAQLAVFAGMGMAWAMFRGKKKKYEDEDGELTTQSMLTALGKDMVGGALAGIPFGSDAWEAVSSKLFGDAYYGMDAVTVQALNDAVQSLGGMGKLIEDTVRAASAGEKIDWRSAGIKFDSYIDDISKAAGVPWENVANLVYAIQRQVAVHALGEIQGEYAAMKWTVDPEKKSGEYYDLLYKALERGDLDSYFTIREELPELLGKDNSDIDGAMKSRYTARVKKDPAYSLSERACDLLGIRAKLDSTEKEAVFSPDDLDSKTFQNFQEQRADRWRAAQVKLEGNALYGKLSNADKDKVMNAVWEYAHQTALAETSGGKYTPTSSWIADAQAAATRGVQLWEYVLYKTAYGTGAAYSALEKGNLTEYKTLRGKYMDVLGKDGTGADAAMRSEYEDRLEANPRYTLNQAAMDLIGIHPSGSSDSGDSFGADDLARAAYDAYTTQRAAAFRETVDYIEDLPSYRDMDQDTRDKLVSMAYTMAHQIALADNSDGQYSPTYTWVRDALDAQEEANIDAGEFLLWKTAYNMASSDKDENDKPIKGREKKDKVRAWLLSQEDLTPEQRAYLWGTEYKSAW